MILVQLTMNDTLSALSTLADAPRARPSLSTTMEVDTIVINARRKVDALAVMAATDSQLTSDDPVGALMAKYDKDKNGTFDVHECAA